MIPPDRPRIYGRTPAPNGPLALLPQHLADLRRSGLTDDTIRACGFRSEADPAGVGELLRWAGPAAALGPCLVVPFVGLDGTPAGYARVKPDRPRAVGPKNKPAKYESPRGVPTRAYFPPATRAALAARDALATPDTPLIVTEGEKKAARADQDGFPCVGLVGVDGWSVAGSKPRKLIPDLAAVAWKGRPVFVAFDSDAAANPNVRRAEWQLAEALRAAGAVVAVVRLPAAADGSKQGLDDFLVARGPDALRDLLAPRAGAAPPAGPPAPAAPPADGAADADGKKKGPAAADLLVALARGAGVELFHTPDHEAFAAVPAGGRVEVHAVRGAAFRRWLAKRFYDATGRACHAEAMATAVGTLEGVAAFDGPEHPVHLRVAPGPGGGVVLDLGDDGWRAVVVRPGGWEVAAPSPARFRRPQAMRPLPEPARGGRLADLRTFLHLRSDDDWLLVAAWAAAALRPAGPYPVLHWKGEQGTAKTTSGRLVRRLFDPAAVDLRSQPREERDLAVASRGGWMVGYDNLSNIPVWLSDALCRVATGGGFGTRALYTNDEECVFDFCRPVMVTSIEDVVGQPDLLDRTLAVELAPIPDGGRRTERELWAAFDAARPGIFGGLLDTVAAALALLPAVEAEGRPLPRMADFALFGEAVARSLGAGPGHFLSLLAAAGRGADQSALEGSPVALTLFHLVKAGGFTGSMTELLAALTAAAGDDARRREWPANAKALGGLVRKIGPALRRVGIGYSKQEVGHQKVKTYTFTYTPAGDGPDGARNDSPATPARDPNLFAGDDLSAGDRASEQSPASRPQPRRSPATDARAGERGRVAGEMRASGVARISGFGGQRVTVGAGDAGESPPQPSGRTVCPVTGATEVGEI